MTNYQVVSVIIAVVVASVALIQLTIVILSLRTNHRRQKQQSTIEYMRQIRDKYTEIDYALIKKFKRDELSNDDVEQIQKDPELWPDVIYLLGMFEHLAVGVNSDVFDLRVLNRMSGGYIIRIYRQYSAHIKKVGVYHELEDLVNKLASLRRPQVEH